MLLTLVNTVLVGATGRALDGFAINGVQLGYGNNTSESALRDIRCPIIDADIKDDESHQET